MTTATTITAHGWTGHLNQGLAPRELECLLGIAGGCSNKELARDLALQPDTIKKTVSRALLKMGVTRRAALVAEAMRRGLISTATTCQPEPDHNNDSDYAGVLIA